MSDFPTPILPLEKLVNRDMPIDAQTRDLLLSHIKTQILPSVVDKGKPIDHAMTFSLIRHIVQPSPLQWPLIPNLLKLLVQVERIRKLCVGEVEKYLSLLGTRTSQNAVLNKDVIKKLQRICKPKSNESMRKIFQTTVLGLCEMHINRLWTSEESYILPKQMRTYFPSLHIEGDARFSDNVWQHHYLYDSTMKEREEMHEEGMVCKAFLDKARRWENDWRTSRQNGENREGDSFEQSFSTKFPGPNEEILVQNIRIFIERVEGYVLTSLEYAQLT